MHKATLPLEEKHRPLILNSLLRWKHRNGSFGFLWSLSRKTNSPPIGDCGTGNQCNSFQRSSFPKNVTPSLFPGLQMGCYITADWGFLDATSSFLFQLKRQAIHLNSLLKLQKTTQQVSKSRIIRINLGLNYGARMMPNVSASYILNTGERRGLKTSCGKIRMLEWKRQRT